MCMNIGWAYLGLATISILVGAYLGMIQNSLIGDLLMIGSLGFIYLGSRSLADADVAADLVENAHGTAESTSDDTDE